MDYQEAIKEAETQIYMYESMILYNKDFEPKNDNSNYENKIDFLKTAIYAMQELQEYKKLGTLEELRETVKELKLYKDAKLCLIPEDVFSKQCEEVDAYRELGTLEEVREAMEKQKAISREIIEGKYFCPKCHNLMPYPGYCGCGQKLY